MATDDKTNRFNDAQCDRRGRLWSGTLTVVEGKPGTFLQNQALLFSYDGSKQRDRGGNPSRG